MNWILWGDCVTNFLLVFFSHSFGISYSRCHFHILRRMHVNGLFQPYLSVIVCVCVCVYVVYFVAAFTLLKRAFRLLHIKYGMCVAYHIPYFYFIAIICDDATFSVPSSTMSTFECFFNTVFTQFGSFNSVSITIETFAHVKINSLSVQVLSLRVTSIECMTRKREAKLSFFFSPIRSSLSQNENEMSIRKIRQFPSI